MVRVADPGRTVVDVTDGRFTDTDPVVHRGRQVPGVPVRAQLRPGVRRARLRPVLPVRVPPVPGPAGRGDAVAVRPAARRPAGRRPRGGRGRGPGQADRRVRPRRQAGRQDGKREAAPRPVVDTEGLAGRVVQIPVAESRYSSLRAVKGGLAWLREPVTGKLGEGGPQLGRRGAAAEPGALRPGRAAVHRAGRRAGLVRGQRRRQRRWSISDHGKLCVVPANRKPDSDNPADRVTVDKSRARYLADPAALWRNAYAEAGPLHPARLLGGRPGRGGLGRRARALPAAAGPDRRSAGLRRPAVGGARRARHLARLRPRGRRRR